MTLPHDYEERVYAGVLGKIIGVYLGRPIEGWSHERIMEEYGEFDRYVKDRRGAPLVVTDDDISGTFTFLRAMPDHGNRPDLAPREIGESWLNYILERKTILWWGGVGNSTEHTAYVRLKQGVPAPESGSEALNGKLIAEQIGAQAFVERDLNVLLDTAVSLIPADSVIARLIGDVREWHAAEPDWRKTRERIAGSYGYDKFGGNCHMVPNHALVIHALLHGEDDFTRSQMIVNTCGWDTDCNAANVGCIMGIKNGLAGIDAMAYDWRGPVADRMYLATADGGRGVTDAVIESVEVIDIARALEGLPPLRPKGGARFHFSFPGSVQGFRAEGAGAAVENRAHGAGRALAVVSPGAARASTPTFIPEEAIAMPGYALYASPTLYPGQEIAAALAADAGNPGPVRARLFLRVYGPGQRLETVEGPAADLAPGEAATIAWTAPQTGGQPVAEIGVAVDGAGTVLLDSLGWTGPAGTVLARPAGDTGEAGEMWRRAWVEAVDQWEARWPQAYRIVQNEGTGVITQGTADWADYRVAATVQVPLASEAGLAARTGGQRRWYGFLLSADGTARIVREADGRTVLAEAPFAWEFDRDYALELSVAGDRIAGSVDGRPVVEARDGLLAGGGAGLVVGDGCLIADAVSVART